MVTLVAIMAISGYFFYQSDKANPKPDTSAVTDFKAADVDFWK